MSFELKNKEPFKLSLGQRGEMLAAAYLVEKGYLIVDRNYRCSLGELDLVAMSDGKLRFVEVKTRSSIDYGYPEEAVDQKKQHKLRQLALLYLKEKNKENDSATFDVLSILWHPKKEPIFKLIQDAF
jgi:putative endonuclease